MMSKKLYTEEDILNAFDAGQDYGLWHEGRHGGDEPEDRDEYLLKLRTK